MPTGHCVSSGMNHPSLINISLCRNKPPCVHLEVVPLLTPEQEQQYAATAAAAAAAAKSKELIDALNASVEKCQHELPKQIEAMLTGEEVSHS